MNASRTPPGKGVGWLVLLGIPPLIVAVGLVAFIVWQVRKGTITPKWKPKEAPTATQPGATNGHRP